MTKLIYRALTVAVIFSISAAVIFTKLSCGNIHKPSKRTTANGYIAILNGKNEVPSHPDVSATGISGFIVNSAKSKIWYQIEAEGLNKVTQAHIHSGKSGDNGPIVAILFTGKKDAVNGALVQGSITADTKNKKSNLINRVLIDSNLSQQIHSSNRNDYKRVH
jgi:hypothetical protein